MLELLLLGPLDVRTSDGPRAGSVLAQPRRVALLAHLALAAPGAFVRRDALLALFWPEADQEHARAALRQALSYLRRSLGDGVIETRGDEEVRLAAARVRCDVPEFRGFLERGERARALELYRGELLEGFHVDGAPGFERWVEGERARLRGAAARAAGGLAEAAAGAGKWEEAVGWARRACEFLPGDEAPLRRLLTLLEAGGDRAGAARAYEEFAARLAADLEVEPSPETQALISAIRERRAPLRSDEIDTDPGPPRAVTAPPALGPRGLHVGRRSTGVIAAGIAAALVVTALVPGAPKPFSRPSDPHHENRILVVPFEDRTGHGALGAVGTMAADWIVQGLSGEDELQVVPLAAVLGAATPGSGGWAAGGEAAEARLLSRETGAGTIVSGSYYTQGDSILFQLRITRAADGQVLHAPRPVAAPTDRPLDGVQRLRDQVMLALAPLGDARGTHLRVAAQPPHYQAYRAYVDGMEAFVRRDLATAGSHWEAASAADSSFFLPRLALSILRLNEGRRVAADTIAREVAGRRAALGPFEAATLDMVQAWLRGDHAGAHEASLRQARIAPGSIGHYQVAQQAFMLNRPREAVRVLTEIGPERGELRGFIGYWRVLAESHHLLGDHRREAAAAREARTHYPGSVTPLQLEIRALAARGREAELRAVLEERASLSPEASPSRGFLLVVAAEELAAHGHPVTAARIAAEAVTWYDARVASDPGALGWRRGRVRALVAAGRWEDAEDAALRLAAGASAEDLALEGYRGVFAARRGDHAAAADALERLAAWPEPFLWGEHTYWRARIAAQLGEEARAVELLRQAFAEGVWDRLAPHADPFLAPLRGNRAFREFLRPRG